MHILNYPELVKDILMKCKHVIDDMDGNIELWYGNNGIENIDEKGMVDEMFGMDARVGRPCGGKGGRKRRERQWREVSKECPIPECSEDSSSSSCSSIEEFDAPISPYTSESLADKSTQRSLYSIPTNNRRKKAHVKSKVQHQSSRAKENENSLNVASAQQIVITNNYHITTTNLTLHPSKPSKLTKFANSFTKSKDSSFDHISNAKSGENKEGLLSSGDRLKIRFRQILNGGKGNVYSEATTGERIEDSVSGQSVSFLASPPLPSKPLLKYTNLSSQQSPPTSTISLKNRKLIESLLSPSTPAHKKTSATLLSPPQKPKPSTHVFTPVSIRTPIPPSTNILKTIHSADRSFAQSILSR